MHAHGSDIGERSAPCCDLDDPEQIREMVRRFYADVAQDELLGPIFHDVARVDWSEHIAKLTAYWCRLLLGEAGYVGQPLRAHARIHAVHPFTAALFDRWLRLFHETVELGWSGPRADRARSIATNLTRVHARHLIGEAEVPG